MSRSVKFLRDKQNENLAFLEEIALLLKFKKDITGFF